MSGRHEALVTVTLDGDETDLAVRGWVLLEAGLGMGGSWGAAIDGGVELFVRGEWVSVDDLELDPRDVDQIHEALCDAAFEAAA